MLNGGLLARTTNGLYGPTGIGKTTFGLQFVSLSSAEQPGGVLRILRATRAVAHQGGGDGYRSAAARGSSVTSS